MAKPLRISASSVKTLTDCALSFYYSRVLKMPEKQWPRTTIGSLLHSICECLRHARHRHHYDAIVIKGDGATILPAVDYTLSPSVARLVAMWKAKYRITDELLADLNPMLYVALVLLDFHWVNADIDPVTGKPMIYGPEHEFKLVLEDGVEIKGYIDDMAVVGGVMQIRDFKSAREKPVAREVPHNIQAAIYQLYVWLTFGLLARVEFVYVRHAPTPRAKARHLQIVEPASPTMLLGLVEYLKIVHGQMNSLTLEWATQHPHDDPGFCERVCSHYRPHPYWVITDPADPDTIVSSHLSLDEARAALKDGQVIAERRHTGCEHAWHRR